MSGACYVGYSYCLAYTQRQPNSLPLSLGGYHFLWKAVPNLWKVSVNKTATPLFRLQKFYDPPPPIHLTPPPPKQAKIVLNSVPWNKINTLSVVILWLPTFLSSKILWPPYFSFPNFCIPTFNKGHIYLINISSFGLAKMAGQRASCWSDW